jgi:hypothetical protein
MSEVMPDAVDSISIPRSVHLAIQKVQLITNTIQFNTVKHANLE